MNIGAPYLPTYIPELNWPVLECYRTMFEQMALRIIHGFAEEVMPAFAEAEASAPLRPGLARTYLHPRRLAALHRLDRSSTGLRPCLRERIAQ
jgi:hypothetical protein